ncbi:MAG: thioesterase, partial [Nocardiopsaceae bacterium]|nr:thioesterase [Nocardiopsaceae bacterium]
MTIESVRSGQWVRRFRTGPAAPSARLICFPHAGGSATFYFPVAKRLPADVELLAIQYPGRQDRRGEACVEDIRVLADRVAEKLAELADQPFALFGHSLGATVAFETALRLQEERGVSPVRLYASGRRAPSCHREESLHLRDDAHLIEEMKQMDGTDPQVFANEEVLRMVLPSFRSDYRAAETYRYRPGPALDCPVT